MGQDDSIRIGEEQEPDKGKNGGWIHLHRRLRDHWIWDKPEMLRAWIDLLLSVRWKEEPQKVMLGLHLVLCGKGQSLNSIGTWADRWGWSQSRVRRFFELLKSDGMIVTEATNNTTRLTVVNYGEYNKVWRAGGEPSANPRRTLGEPSTTEEEGEEREEGKEGGEKPAPSPLAIEITAKLAVGYPGIPPFFADDLTLPLAAGATEFQVMHLAQKERSLLTEPRKFARRLCQILEDTRR